MNSTLPQESLEHREITPFTQIKKEPLIRSLFSKTISQIPPYAKISLPLHPPAEKEEKLHPIFMPRNEEEAMRNMVILAQQLKYVDAPPQMIIAFEMQTTSNISFTVTLVRLLKAGERSTAELLKHSGLNPLLFEHKTVGLLRKKHPKEATVFQCALEKHPFLRPDNSLDLFKARRTLSQKLCALFGDIRDYNGGILSRRHETFQALADETAQGNPYTEFLIENFFYALTPSLMQSLLPGDILKKLFNLLIQAMAHPYAGPHPLEQREKAGEYLLTLFTSCTPFLNKKLYEYKENLSLLSSARIQIDDVFYTGFIYNRRQT